MLPSFETLEQRQLLAADLLPRIEGPNLAFTGDQVSYVLAVTNQGDQAGTKKVEVGVFPPLVDPQWATKDGTEGGEPTVLKAAFRPNPFNANPR